MADGFVFDDEPLESILYGEPGAGPTPAGLFASAEPFVSAIEQAFERGETDEWLRLMAELFTRGYPVSVQDLICFTALIGSLVPLVPWPIVQDRSVPCDTHLEHLFSAGLAKDDNALTERAGTTLYRYYEGCGRYADAARVVSVLLDMAKKKGNRIYEAVYTNNLGFDYMLDSDWARAEEWFARAAELFGWTGLDRELANAHLNVLLVRYEQAGDEPPERFEHEASKLLETLGDDWRRRKALILLARIAERRGDQETAAQLARQAVEASGDIPTRHRLEDLDYLERVEMKRHERRPTG